MSFIPDATTLIQFTIAAVILAITPGPDMTLFVSRTLSQGRAVGFASMAGALSGRNPVQSATQSGASRRNASVPNASGKTISRLPP